MATENVRRKYAHSHPLLLNGVQTENKIKELKIRSQQLLGEKKKGVVYKIPSKRENAVHAAEP